MNSSGCQIVFVFAASALCPAMALAIEDYVFEMGNQSLPARSLLLWPPDRPVPDGVYFLFDADGPIQDPFELTILMETWHCEPGGPAIGVQLEYLQGVSYSANLAFAEPTGHLAGPTDAAGRAEIVLPLHGGGHGANSDWELSGPDVECCIDHDTHLMINSPDIDGDLTVNLADLSLFAADFFGAYNYRSDLSWNGAIDIGDLTYMSLALFNR
jgi:hypothetical protein